MVQAPKLDKRTGPEIAKEVYGLLPIHVENWPDQRERGELADALIHVFARFGEIIIDRLNKSPEKNFMAFLDLLGISPLPLQAARAPITFYLAGSASHAIVPAGTQVAAAPAKGEQKPVIFETQRQLVVVSARLESLIIKDGGRDQCTDFSAIIGVPSPLSNGGTADAAGTPPTIGNVIVIPHALCIPLPAFAVWPVLNKIRLKVELDADVPHPIDARTLQWELCIAVDSKPTTAAAQSPVAGQEHGQVIRTIVLEPMPDETENLTKSGDIVFLNVPDTPSLVLDDLPGRWLRCRLLTPISSLPEPSVGVVRNTQLPGIRTLTIETQVERTGLSLEQAFFNKLKLDLTKDFFPFGEKPKFGDIFYLGSREAFSNPDAALTFHVTVTNSASSGSEEPLPAAKPQGTKLQWEFWDGEVWAELGTAEIDSRRIRIRMDSPEASTSQFSDGTQAFSESGDVSFRFPKSPARLKLNGEDNYWIRVRIVAGDYGKEAHYEQKGGLLERELKGGVALVPATLAPPSIRSIKIDYAVRKESQPDILLTYNDFAYAKISPHGVPFKPFLPTPPDQVSPSLYFGFTLPPSSTASTAVFPDRPMCIYVGVAASAAGQSAHSFFDSAVATWEYWNGVDWMKWTVLDDTQGFRRAGLIRFLAPSDFAPSQRFGHSRYWLRMRQRDRQFRPKFCHVLLNTTMAIEGITCANEVLGTSNGTPSQQYRTTQTPVLAGQNLEVCEPTDPSKKERAEIRAEEGGDAITRVSEPTGKGDAFWVRWHEVPNFYGSGPRDRHYLIDRVIGEVTFGDGINGMIPPALPSNIRSSYRAGGGVAGNQSADAITQLKSAIPYIQKASNCEAASGGTDSELDSELFARGPLGIRHGGRAVTQEDFEDLAALASREVARAKCVPLVDLSQDLDAQKRKPGVVSLIVLPRSTDLRPRPSLDLLDRVRSYLDSRRQLTSDLMLVGPEYARVDIDCEIVVSDPEAASEVELVARKQLERSLHPVTGGDEGTGWDFGRQPRRSDFVRLLGGIPGVSHVRELRVSMIPDRPGSEKTGRFLICSGNHRVTTKLED